MKKENKGSGTYLRFVQPFSPAYSKAWYARLFLREKKGRRAGSKKKKKKKEKRHSRTQKETFDA